MPFLRVCLVLCLCSSAGFTAELRMLSGDPQQGEMVLKGDLARLDGAQVTLLIDGEERNVPLEQVLQIDLGQPRSIGGLRYIDVELTDGSLLHCSQFVVKGTTAELMVLPSLPVKVPLRRVRYVLNEAHDAATRQEWQEFLTKQKGVKDVLAVKRDGVLNGLEGILGAGDDKGETIEFELDSGRVFRPQLAKIHGMILTNKPDINPPVTKCKLYDTYQNMLFAASLTYGPEGYTVETVSGAKLTYPSKDLIARLDFSKGKRTFLSDLEPLSVEVSSSEDRLGVLLRDQGLEGKPIRLAGIDPTSAAFKKFAATPYDKGLLLMARTVLVYRLDGDYNELRTVLGVDAQVGDETQARLAIAGDGKELFTTIVRRQDNPQEIALNIRGVKELRITVTPVGLIDLMHHVVLADAKVSK